MGALEATKRGCSGEEGARGKDEARGVPSMKEGSALLDRRSGKMRQGKQDSNSGGEGPKQ